MPSKKNKSAKSAKAKIAEIFCSYQGEGTLAGQKHVFVRFSGCNLSCSYCDTQEPKAATLSAAEALGRIRKVSEGADTVSFTGGEPLLHAGFIKKVAPALKKNGFVIYLETNGTLVGAMKDVLRLIDIVAMDFKFPSDCGEDLWETHQKFIAEAGANVLVKAVVSANTRDAEIRRALKIIKNAERKKGIKIPLVLQPVTPTGVKPAVPAKIKKWLGMARKELSRVYLVPQMQRYWGVR